MSSDMEAVNLFNSELMSLYDVKPPISKGKMTSITRAALKAVKLYKHVVQSVEKFIQKCKPEYKIPGLYVIDSIIRQSRHQFGSEKDVFATRFARNLTNTFMHLYKCPDDEKAKVIRVLNLWQKNKIFMPEVIAPLFDLANPNHEIWEKMNSQSQSGDAPQNNNSNNASNKNPPSGEFGQVHFKKELLDYDYDDDAEPNNENSTLQQIRGGEGLPSSNSVQGNSTTPSASSLAEKLPQNFLSNFDALGSLLANPEVLRQLQTLQEQMAAAATVQQQQNQQHNQFSTPEQERQRKLAELNKQEAAFEQRLAQTVARLPFAVDCDFDSNKSADHHQGQDDMGHLNNINSGGNNSQLQAASLSQQQSSVPNMTQLLPPAFFHQLETNPNMGSTAPAPPPHLHNVFESSGTYGSGGTGGQFGQQSHHLQQHDVLSQGMYSQFNNYNQQQQITPNQIQGPGFDDKERGGRGSRRRSPDPPILAQLMPTSTTNSLLFDTTASDTNSNYWTNFSSMSSLSRSRSPIITDRNRKSRSRSRSRSRRRSRSGSRGRSNRRKRSRSRERREEKEREKERARKGFPPMRKDHLSVCSTTLWVGHLSKLVSQEEISDTFGAYGDIVSIDLISPRGCAFVVMNRRQDALRALDRLKNVKLQGKAITLAWAPGKSVKGREWKDYWEVEQGVSYIPWTKLRHNTNIDDFEDGGCIDEDTLPSFLRDRPKAVPSGGSAMLSSQEQQGMSDTKDSSSENALNMPQAVPSSKQQSSGAIPPLLQAPAKVPMMMDGGHTAGGSVMPQSSQSVPGGVQAPNSSASVSGDTDARSELTAVAAAAVHGQPVGPVPNAGPPGMVQPFVGMPPQVGLMGMPPQFGMMVPPPMMGGPGGPGMPPFGPPNPAMLGVMGPQGLIGPPGGVPPTGVPPPGGPLGANPNNVGPGLLGDMPMLPHTAAAVLQQMNNSLVDMSGGTSGNSIGSFTASAGESEVKRGRSDDDVSRGAGEGQKRKKSRFEDVPEDAAAKQALLDRRNKDDARVPLHERLKNIADYGIEAANNANRAGLLGAPRAAPPGINNLLFPTSAQPPIGDRAAQGFIRPLFPSPSATSNSASLGSLGRGSGTWGFDSSNDSTNPFVNPNNPNPFVGNPFMQQGGANPFDVNASFEDFNSPNSTAAGVWSQQSPQKWGGREPGRGGGTWGRGDSRGGRDDRFSVDSGWGSRDRDRGDRDRDRDRRDRDRENRGGGRERDRDWNPGGSTSPGTKDSRSSSTRRAGNIFDSARDNNATPLVPLNSSSTNAGRRPRRSSGGNDSSSALMNNTFMNMNNVNPWSIESGFGPPLPTIPPLPHQGLVPPPLLGLPPPQPGQSQRPHRKSESNDWDVDDRNPFSTNVNNSNDLETNSSSNNLWEDSKSNNVWNSNNNHFSNDTNVNNNLSSDLNKSNEVEEKSWDTKRLEEEEESQKVELEDSQNDIAPTSEFKPEVSSLSPPQKQEEVEQKTESESHPEEEDETTREVEESSEDNHNLQPTNVQREEDEDIFEDAETKFPTPPQAQSHDSEENSNHEAMREIPNPEESVPFSDQTANSNNNNSEMEAVEGNGNSGGNNGGAENAESESKGEWNSGDHLRTYVEVEEGEGDHSNSGAGVGLIQLEKQGEKEETRSYNHDQTHEDGSSNNTTTTSNNYDEEEEADEVVEGEQKLTLDEQEDEEETNSTQSPEYDRQPQSSQGPVEEEEEDGGKDEETTITEEGDEESSTSSFPPHTAEQYERNPPEIPRYTKGQAKENYLKQLQSLSASSNDVLFDEDEEDEEEEEDAEEDPVDQREPINFHKDVPPNPSTEEDECASALPYAAYEDRRDGHEDFNDFQAFSALHKKFRRHHQEHQDQDQEEGGVHRQDDEVPSTGIPPDEDTNNGCYNNWNNDSVDSPVAPPSWSGSANNDTSSFSSPGSKKCYENNIGGSRDGGDGGSASGSSGRGSARDNNEDSQAADDEEEDEDEDEEEEEELDEEEDSVTSVQDTFNSENNQKNSELTSSSATTRDETL